MPVIDMYIALHDKNNPTSDILINTANIEAVAEGPAGQGAIVKTHSNVYIVHESAQDIQRMLSKEES